MPWQIDGTFLRINPDYTGNVWDKDQKADIKVIATRHDFHDNDLANGIAGCLNLDGYNKMRADLDMNNFKIINAANGTAPTDLVVFNQLLDTMTFDDPTRTLTLSSPAGQVLTAVIPSGSGGGGEGTVTSIDIGEGLDGANDPIVTSGDIKLETIGTGQSYSGGIGAITIDKHGRVTSVTGNSGGGGSVVLQAVTSTTTATVRDANNTSNAAVIPAATTLKAGVMTAAMRSDLNDAVAGIPEAGQNTGDMLYWSVADQWERTGLVSAFGSTFTVSGTLDVNGSADVSGNLTVGGDLGAVDGFFTGNVVVNGNLGGDTTISSGELSGSGTIMVEADTNGILRKGSPVASIAKTAGVEALIDELVTQGVFPAGTGTTLKAAL